jgi:hypothetical protein
MALAAMFGQLHRTSAWLIGDLLNYGEKVYGETYAQAETVTGLSRGTLMNYSSVCAHIPRSRRRENVPFSTHAEVAYLEPEEQEKWLEQAAVHGWTKSELRDARTPKLTTVVMDCVCPNCGNTHSTDGEAKEADDQTSGETEVRPVPRESEGR